ncbi:hypothetical protein RvY_15664-10 [Ramazzottius varieornatus]|uniref:EF-hand domain-containing protein n=1 Tax=Ramazzottius varieornatus TaxID=947166 RepID=A0A1D1VVR3_RAMVA|nr:hypothetical protein RvY_15664-10 [Ramazzottius varieornatus]
MPNRHRHCGKVSRAVFTILSIGRYVLDRRGDRQFCIPRKHLKIYDTVCVVDASYFARQIFQLMDQDMDGSVTFEEYLVVMSMLSRGSLDEKVQWVFNLYDSNGEGQLTAEKLTDVAVSVYEMLGSYTDPPWINETTIKDHVARVFSKMDTNQDGIVTFTEFKEFCITDEGVRRNFGVFDSSL